MSRFSLVEHQANARSYGAYALNMNEVIAKRLGL
jgi:hypothetical protein